MTKRSPRTRLSLSYVTYSACDAQGVLIQEDIIRPVSSKKKVTADTAICSLALDELSAAKSRAILQLLASIGELKDDPEVRPCKHWRTEE